MIFHKPAKGARSAYRLSASREGVHIEFMDGNFFNNDIIDRKGTTALDINIAQVVQEVRSALYYIGTDSTAH